MKKLFQESIPVISTFLPKLIIITVKGLLWYREASLLQHCDSNLRLIRQEGIEKKIVCIYFMLWSFKGLLIFFYSAFKPLVLSFTNFKTYLFEVTVKILSFLS